MADGTVKILTELVTDGLRKGLKTATGLIAGAAGGLSALAAAALKVGTSFEDGMAQVAATMGITKDTIDANGVKPFEVLEQAAKDAGEATKYSATEAAEALNYLALAGYDAQTAADTLPAVLNLASAGGLDLAYASDLATDAMAALGIEASNANLTQFGDKMAKTASKANTSVGQLGEAILTVGGTAKGLAGGTTELNAALGVLANRGIKGAEGGTALRNVILSLTAPTDKAAETMKELGLEVNDAEGNMRPLNEVFRDLDKSLSEMSESEKTQVLNEIFNKVDLKSAQALLAGCGDEFTELAANIDDSDGAMQQMADTMNDTLNGQVTILKSGLEGLGIAIYQSVEEPLKSLAKEAQNLVGEMTSAFKSGGLAGLAESMGSVMAQVVNTIVAAAPKAADAAVAVVGGLLNGLTKNASSIARGATQAAANIVTGLLSILPQMLTTAAKLITELTKGIAKQAPKIISSAVKTVTELVKGIAKSLPQLVSAGMELVKGLADGVIKAIPQLIAAVPEIVDTMVKAINQAIPVIMQAGVELLGGIVQSIPTIVQALAAAIPQIIVAIVDGLASGIPNIVIGAVQLFSGIVEAIPKIIVELVKAIPQIIMAIVSGLLGGIASIVQAAIQLFSPVNEQAGVTAEQMEAAGEKAGAFAQALQNATPAATDFANALSASGNSMSDLDAKIQECEERISETLKAAYAEQSGLRDEDLEDIRNYTAEWQKLQQEKLGIYQSETARILAETKAQSGSITAEQAAEIVANAKSAQEQTLSALSEMCESEKRQLYERHQAAGTINSTAYNEELAALEANYAAQEASVRAGTNEIYNVLAESGAQQSAATQEAWNSIGQKTAEGVAQTGNILSGIGVLAGEAAYAASSEFSAGVTGIPDAGSGAMLGVAAAIKENGGSLESAAREQALAALAPFENLSDDAAEAGKNTLLGMIEGMEGVNSALGDTSEMSAQQIVDTIKAYLGIASPSTVLAEIGMYAVQGLTQGIQSGQSEPAAAMSLVASGMLDIINASGFNSAAMSAQGKSAVGGLASGVASGKANTASAAAAIASSAVKSVASGGLNAANMSKAGRSAASGLASGTKSGQSGVSSAAGAIGKAAANAVKNTTMSSSIMSGIGKTAANGLASGTRSGQSGVVGATKTIGTQAASVLRNTTMSSSVMSAIGKTAMTGLLSGVRSGQSGVTSAMKTVGAGAQSAIKSSMSSSTMKSIGSAAVNAVSSGASGAKGRFVSNMRSIGASAAAGMKSGMNSQISSLVATAHSIASKVTSAFRAKLDINSPSKVIAREVGAPIAEGIGYGFIKSIGDVIQKMTSVVDTDLMQLPVGATAVHRSMMRASVGTQLGGTTYNITNNVESPVPTTVAQSVREANRMTEDTLFRLGVYGV